MIPLKNRFFPSQNKDNIESISNSQYQDYIPLEK